MGGHPDKTWRYIDSKASKPSKLSKIFQKNRRGSQEVQKLEIQRGILWPCDLLPHDVATVRIFTYGYDSHVSHGIRGPANRSNISQHGLTLLNAVSNERHDCLDRSVLFVAHSLGGLLVKQALVESEKAARDGQERNLHKACKAVMFFGTPHRGSPDASWGIVMANIAKVAQFDVNKSMLNDLSPSSNSPTLEVLQDDFNGLMHREKIKVHTFQEGTGKSGVKALSDKVRIPSVVAE